MDIKLYIFYTYGREYQNYTVWIFVCIQFT